MTNIKVYLADTEKSKMIHYHIRYQVYCSELQFEDENNFPDQLERDDWDEHSIHFIAYDIDSDEWVGAVRLLLSDGRQFVCESLCGDLNIDRTSAAEVSRLCVLPHIRRTSNEDGNRPGLLITMKLIQAMMYYCVRHNIINWYMITTSALIAVLKRLKLNVIKLGTGISHKGTRYPAVLSIDQSAIDWMNSIDGTPYEKYSILESSVDHMFISPLSIEHVLDN